MGESLIEMIENLAVMLENPALLRDKIIYGIIPLGIYHNVLDSSISNGIYRRILDWTGNFVKRQSFKAYVNLSDRTFAGKSSLGDVVDAVNTIYQFSPIS